MVALAIAKKRRDDLRRKAEEARAQRDTPGDTRVEDLEPVAHKNTFPKLSIEDR